MNFANNIQYFSNDLSNDITHFFDSVSVDNYDNFNCRNLFNRFMDLSNAITKKSILHFPKTVTLALVIHAFTCIIFFSFFNMLSLALSLYFFHDKFNLLKRSLRIYNNNNVSEWNSTVAQKEIVINIISPIIRIQTTCEKITDLFRELYLNIRDAVYPSR